MFFVSFSWNVDLCSDPLVPRIEKQKVETGAIENKGRKDTTGPSNVAPLSTTHVNCIGAVAGCSSELFCHILIFFYFNFLTKSKVGSCGALLFDNFALARGLMYFNVPN